MLGLPSTTDTDTRLPKEAIARNVGLDAKTRAMLTDGIERVTVRNAIKPTTLPIPAGTQVNEIMLVEMRLKERTVPRQVLTAIARANTHRLVFACTYDDECRLAVLLDATLAMGDWQPTDHVRLVLSGVDLDEVWNALASQVVYGDDGNGLPRVEERHRRDMRVEELKQEADRLRRRSKKERQFSKRNELFMRAKRLENQIRTMQEDAEWNG